MDASFHGGSNDTIGGRVRPRQPEILLSSHGGNLVLTKRFAVLQKEQTSVFRKFAEIFANECLSAVSTTPGIKLVPGVVDTCQINQKS
jgi:hypothetical protein